MEYANYPSTDFVAGVLALVLVVLVYRRTVKAPSTLPPGPPTDSFIFGHYIPSCDAFRKFEDWTKQYGQIFSLRQGFTTVVVIGRYQAAVEIMEREGAHLADRPVSIAAGETVSGGNRLLLIPVGERFKKLRKVLHSHLQPKVVQTHTPTLMKNAKRLVLDVLQRPDIHHEHSKRYSAAITLALAYGKSAGGFDDPEVIAVNRCLSRLGSALQPGAWKVDFYPWLRYVPGYLRELRELHEAELKLFNKHLGDVKRMIATGGDPAVSSFAKHLLTQQSALQLSDDEVAYTAAALFGTDGDTTATAISVGIFAAACFPEAQRKVQEELDTVVGLDRAPTFEDELDLPQLQAFILEAFRWCPVAPLGGFAHRATKAIVWQNYVVPKGATVIGNIWSIGRDPAVFPNPDSFDPQRWLTRDGKIHDDLKLFVFGFGRRVCPGQHLATASVFINTALVLWAFRLSRSPENASEVQVEEVGPGCAEKAKVVFEPRLGGYNGDGIREMLRNYGGSD